MDGGSVDVRVRVWTLDGEVLTVEGNESAAAASEGVSVSWALGWE